ncbi:trans-1,2-dihydrobenzene-1,2-diol dehydrogenase [Carassius gibelio]|uniref:trans-1,2-dihydrobenzene-1,2-diol dehydrogenase n=1 Tax=Carassius gibelio TaxID=101364 RepID=UPI002277FF71|nr:trans-1,2-dihydrobenzene-1,2-diol dehydrogenase [Carassius gibelio]XP_052387922.1 trans-1,2-dihydrobenzene-1,2-diol dehydrogenase [Carassius gibelio]
MHLEVRANMATRWGICGAGNISHDFCVALKTLSHEDHQIVAVAARSLDRAKKFAKTHGIPTAFGSYQELVKGPDIDVVYIGVLHTHHLPVGLMFLNAGKNVLCEKPLAMNHREVMHLISAARENNVFLMEAVWSRCFPVYAEVDRLLSENTVGEVKVVRVCFGLPLLHRERTSQKEQGGGALINIGIYCLQFALMVFKRERPESIHATGVLLPSGVDESLVVVLKFSGNRMAVCTCSVACDLPNDASICGSTGIIRVAHPMHCPTSLEVKGKETQFPLPDPGLPLNFTNSTGLRYEAEEVRRCLLKGLKESIKMSLADSELLIEVMDEARRQVGVVYQQDSQSLASIP